MARVLATTLAALVFVFGAPAAQAAGCSFPTPPTVLERAGEASEHGARLLQVWEMPDAPMFWSTEDPAGYAEFRARIAVHARETDPRKLLAQTPSANNSLVAAKADRWIGPSNCLEKLLQQTQDARIDTFKAPTEFAAALLRSDDGTRLRVYYYTVNRDGIGRVDPLIGPAAQAHAEGWRLAAVLHNHNFHPDQPLLNAALAPSTADAQLNVRLAQQFGLAEAWITNGLHTARIPAGAFKDFDGGE